MNFFITQIKHRNNQILFAFLIALVMISTEVSIFNKPLYGQVSLGLDEPDFVPSTTAEDLEKERLENERIEEERIEEERVEKERLENERIEEERAEKKRLENDRIEEERVEKKRPENERIEKERFKSEEIQKERLKNERIEKGHLLREELVKKQFEKKHLEKETLGGGASDVQISSEASNDTLNNDQINRAQLTQEEANDEEIGYVEEEINENPNPPLAPEFLIKTKEEYLQHRRDLHEGWFEAEGYLSAKNFSRRVKVPVSEWNDEEYFETASDTYYRIGLDLTTPGAKRYEFHLFATARQRKDDGNNTGFDPFENIGYTRESKWMANIYEAHLAVNYIFPYMRQLRIGRMGGPRGPDELFYFDGLAAEFNFFTKMQLSLYGGSTVHLYEYYEKQDLIAGFGIDWEFAEESIFNFDYLYADDKRKTLTPYKGVYNDRKDEQVSLEVWHRINNNSKVMLKYRNLNKESRDIKLRTIVEFPSTSTEISLKYFRQFETTDELSNTFAVFWVILREFLPWHAIDAKLRQRLGWNFLLDLGWYQSELLEEIPEEAYEFRGALNRDYTRNYAVLAVEDLLLDGLSMSLTVEHWDHSNKQFKDLQKSTDTTGWEVAYRFKRSGNRGRKGPTSSEISAGSYFMVHKYDYYDLDPRLDYVRYAEYFGRQERTEVQTYFAKFKAPIWFFTLSGGYEFEDGLEEYESYFAGLSLNF